MHSTSRSGGPGLGVAPLSAISTPAVEFVHAAHQAGFASVGLRPFRVSDTDPAFPLDLTSAEFRALKGALDETGVTVLDIEVLSVTPELTIDDWLPGIAAGAELGASFLNIVGDDDSLTRFADTVGRITEDARDHGILPVLEPVAYRPFRSFDRAFDIAKDVGCAVELDMLHFLRTGADIGTIRRNAALIPVVQICDAPATIMERADELRAFAADDTPAALEVAESRSSRLLPGDGVVPIRELLAAIAPSTPISVEIPNAALRADRDAAAFLGLLRSRTADFLAGTSAAR